ncbi:retrovirus-related pol polyprotein from transposon TNT 1-94 [Tanacetum coccineum]
MEAGQRKPETQWIPEDRKAANLGDSKVPIMDFQDSCDDEEDTRSSHEYLNDLEEEFQARALLAKSRSSFSQCISEQIPSQKKRILGVDQLTKDPSSSGQKDLVFVKSSANDSKVSIPGVQRPWLFEAEGFILPNHDTGRILPTKSQRNAIDPSVAVNDSLATEYDSADESLVCSTPLPPLKKLDGVEPFYGPKTIKSMLRSKSTFIAETLKGVIINEPSSAPTKEQPRPKVVFGDDSTCTTEGYGSIKCNGIFFTTVSFVNGLKYNLINISQLCDAKYIVQLDEKRGIIFNSNKEVLMIAQRVRDVYVLQMTYSTQESYFFAKASENLNWLWHKRLSHLNFKTTNKLVKQNHVIGLPSVVYSKDKPCSSCEKGKHHRASFKTKQTSSIKKCLHLLHMDLFGPITPRVENQNDIKVKQLRTENGIEFRNRIFVNFYDEKAHNTIPIPIPNSLLSIPSMVTLAPQDRWSQDKHIELVNTIGNPGAKMLTRAMAKEVGAASAHECLFVDFLSEEEPKKNVTNSSVHARYKKLAESSPNAILVNSNMHTLHSTQDSELPFLWMDKRSPVNSMSIVEPKNIKEEMADSAWIESMQEELHQFDRLHIWELVYKPFGKNDLSDPPIPMSILTIRPKYTLEILKKHVWKKGQSIGTPMATKPNLDADLNGEPVDQTNYHSKIGSLMYLTSSRPDIVQALFQMPIMPVALILAKALLEEYSSNVINCPAGCQRADRTAIVIRRAEYITEYQLADMFTKALPEDRFQYLVRRIGMRCLTPAELEVLTNESA